MAAAAQQAFANVEACPEEEPRNLKRSASDISDLKDAAAPDAKRLRLTQWLQSTPRAVKNAFSRAKGQLANSAHAFSQQSVLERPLLPREHLRRATAVAVRAAAAARSTDVARVATSGVGSALSSLRGGLGAAASASVRWAKEAPSLVGMELKAAAEVTLGAVQEEEEEPRADVATEEAAAPSAEQKAEVEQPVAEATVEEAAVQAAEQEPIAEAAAEEVAPSMTAEEEATPLMAEDEAQIQEPLSEAAAEEVAPSMTAEGEATPLMAEEEAEMQEPITEAAAEEVAPSMTAAEEVAPSMTAEEEATPLMAEEEADIQEPLAEAAAQEVAPSMTAEEEATPLMAEEEAEIQADMAASTQVLLQCAEVGSMDAAVDGYEAAEAAVQQSAEAGPINAAVDGYEVAEAPSAATSASGPVCVVAIHPYDGASAQGEGFLELRAGDELLCMSGETHGWAFGQLQRPEGRRACGYFPASYVSPQLTQFMGSA